MICQAGRVVRVEGEQAWVAVAPLSSCRRCAEGRGCGLGIFSAWLGDRSYEIVVARTKDHEVGRAVFLEIQPSALVSAALIAYGLPMLGLLIGLAAGYLIGSELVSLLAGSVGLIGAFFIARNLDNPAGIRVTRSPDIAPVARE